ncbi:hypothetical protein [Mitsuokella multacida]|uniref:hypothetical protein n=1 Tax=Mitsuokella multacida TaxID=52226 RepID=UPI00241C4E05|nr:hypothetical protein [Mitsuokella multacida]
MIIYTDKGAYQQSASVELTTVQHDNNGGAVVSVDPANQPGQTSQPETVKMTTPTNA